MSNNSTECYYTNIGSIICNGTEYIKKEGPLNINDTDFWIYLAIYILLTLGAGLMSGLTLGLLSLDTLSLEVLMKAGIGKEAQYASKLYPIIKHHHILLVTLLLGNAACVESMPIFLDRISDPVTAIIVSVTAVLIFGEIIPQALCKRYGLAIGYYMRPFVYLIMGLSIIISYPISKLLDLIFGHDSSTYYGRSQLKALIDLHGPSRIEVKRPDLEGSKDERINSLPPAITLSGEDDSANGENQTLTLEEVTIIKGALDLTLRTAKDALVPMNKVFMLSDDTVLNQQTFKRIVESGHSRIPIYCNNEPRLLRGILITKMLLQIETSQNMTIDDVIHDKKCFQKLRYVTETTPLYDLLQLFKTGKTGHMAVVVKDDIQEEEMDALERFYSVVDSNEPGSMVSVFPPVIGIITLEDVLERLIQSDINDEGDVMRDNISRKFFHKNKLRQAKSSTSRSRSASRNRRQHSNTDSDYINYQSLGETTGRSSPALSEKTYLIDNKKSRKSKNNFLGV